jgi:hypothetical protein
MRAVVEMSDARLEQELRINDDAKLLAKASGDREASRHKDNWRAEEARKDAVAPMTTPSKDRIIACRSFFDHSLRDTFSPQPISARTVSHVGHGLTPLLPTIEFP